jgi:phosphate uptake regulator
MPAAPDRSGVELAAEGPRTVTRYDGTAGWGLDIALWWRYYERIADHAVSLARGALYLVAGEDPVAS